MDKQGGYIKQVVNNERSEILSRLEQWLETPMIVLGFIWLALLIVELRWGLNPFLERSRHRKNRARRIEGSLIKCQN